jgi:hypothetical protein
LQPDFKTAIDTARLKTQDFHDNNPNQNQRNEYAAVVVFYCPEIVFQGDKAFEFATATPDWEKYHSVAKDQTLPNRSMTTI